MFDSKLIHLYYSLPFLSGSDGSGHWSIGEYYSSHIFPKTWGWIPIWSGGMPFPQFYPPFFFFFNALIAHLLPWVEYLTITKTLVVASALLIPITVVWTATELFNLKTKARDWHTYIPTILSGVLSVFVVTAVGGHSSIGFTLESAINKGFVPQFFALIPILLCLSFLPKIHTSTYGKIGAGLFFFISLLTNVHTALFLVIVITVVALTEIVFERDKALQILLTYTKVFGIAGFSTSFWFFPLLATYDYFTTVPLTFDWNRVDDSVYLLFLISFPLGAILSIRRKNPLILGIILGITLIATMAVFRADQHFPNLPFHMYRWLAITPYINVILLAYIVDSVAFKKVFTRILFALVILLGVFYIYLKEVRIYTDNSIYKNYTEESTEDLISYIAKDPGMTAVGTDNDLGRNASFIIDAKLGLLGVPTLTHIIRESAPSGLFLAPTRNTFSAVFEMAGVRTYIGKNPLFTRQPIEQRVDRAKAIGVRYIVASDEGVVGALGTSTQVTFLEKFGGRSIFEIDQHLPKTTELETLPSLVFTDLNFKVRPPDEMNFTFFSEQALMQNAYPYIHIARSSAQYIEEEDFSRFASLILVGYEYKNMETAIEKILHFAKDRMVHVVESKDPLFEELKKLSSTNTNIKIHQTRLLGKKVQSDKILTSIFDSLKENPVSTKNLPFSPYYIRQTYFPWWKNNTNAPMYAVTPFYTLTFSDKGTPTTTVEQSLVFATGTSVYVGFICTGLALLFPVYTRRRKSKEQLSKHQDL